MLEIYTQCSNVLACDLAIQAKANKGKQWQQCLTCKKYLLMNSFSNKQWKKKKGRCVSYVEELTKAGSVGILLQHNHSNSNGIVDGVMHQEPGKKVRDQAIQAYSRDRKEATAILKGFFTFTCRLSWKLQISIVIL